MSVQPPADDALTHLDAQGAARMVDVGGKDVTARTARARAVVEVSPATARLVAGGDLPKGDAVAVARIAGIQAAKRTHELIPLCHQLRLTRVDVDIAVDVDAGVLTVDTVAEAVDRTGVEMEALVAATVAALTLYDLVKAVERGAVIRDVRLIEKTGGSSGRYVAPGTADG
ncbi:MAG TPA: cyclic pyranopterin monophosphate synthase MoaC [Nitriliruptorales bacterium]